MRPGTPEAAVGGAGSQAQASAARDVCAPPPQAPVVDTVLFATPQAGDAELARQYNLRMNSRRVAFSADLVPQVPCSPIQPACSGDLDVDLGFLVSCGRGRCAAWRACWLRCGPVH